MADFENNSIGPEDGDAEAAPRVDDPSAGEASPNETARDIPEEAASDADTATGEGTGEKPASSGVNGISLAMSLCDAVLYAVGGRTICPSGTARCFWAALSSTT